MGREGESVGPRRLPRREPARAGGCVDSEAIVPGELQGARRSANPYCFVEAEVVQTERVGRFSWGHTHATEGVGVVGFVGPVEHVEDVRTDREGPRPGSEALGLVQTNMLER